MGELVIPEPLITFAKRVRERRKLLGIRQLDLAEAVGLTRTSIANIEAGRQDTTVTSAHAIAKALGLPLADLISDANGELPMDWAARLGAENERLRLQLDRIARIAMGELIDLAVAREETTDV